MKYRYIVALFTFIILSYSANLQSQNHNQLNLTFAPLAGDCIFTDGLSTSNRFDFNVGFEFEVNYKREIGNRMTFGLGLALHKVRYILSDTSNMYGYNGNVIYQMYVKFYKNVLDIPISFGYKLNKNEKNDFIIDVAFHNQILINSVTHFDQNGQVMEDGMNYCDLKWDGWNMYNIALSVGSTYQRKFNNNISLRVSPFAKFALRSVHSMSSAHDFIIGLKLGVGYSF